MNIAVQPIWLNPNLSKPVEENTGKKQLTESKKQVTRVYLATRKDIFLLTDLDGISRRTKKNR